MATVTLDRRQEMLWQDRGDPRRRHRHRRRRIHRHRRPVGLRQVHAAAHGGGAGNGHRRARSLIDGQAGQRQGADGPRHRDGVPELRALSAYVGVRQHGLRAEDRGQTPKPEIAERVRRRRQAAAAGAVPETQAARAVRRPAPARRHGPRHRAQAGGVPVRRAAVEPRRQAAGADAAGDQAAAARTWRHRRFTSPTIRSRR